MPKQLNNEKQIYSGNYNNNTVATLYINSDETDWKYVVLTNENIFLKEINYYKRTVLFVAISYIIIGMLLSYIFSKRNYMPIKKTIEFISTNSHINKNTNLNEYSYMQEAFEKTFFKMNELENKLKEQNDLLRRNFIHKLLHGEIFDKDALESSMKKYEIKFPNEYFSVFIIHNDLNNTKNPITPLIKIAEYTKEILNNEINLYYMINNNYIIFILNSSKNAFSNLSVNLSQCIDRLKIMLEELVNLELSVSVSNLHTSILEISEAYHEAIECLDYVLLYNPDEIVFYKDIENKQNYYFPIGIEQKMINNIKTGNKFEVELLLTQVFNKNFYNNSINSDKGKFLIYDIAGCIFKSLDDNSNIKGSLNEKQILKSLMTARTLKSMKLELEKSIFAICDFFKEQNENNEKSEYGKKINSYISSNFKNIDLNVSMIANHFDLSPSYLSKLYKNETGESILAQINKYRIEESKKLLRSTNKSISEISEQIGFLHDTSFMRTFKKIEGITPGQFRNS